MRKINVYEPVFTEDDAIAAYDTVKSGILSSFGPNVTELERQFAALIGRKHAITCSSGTAGLLISLVGTGAAGSGNSVAVPACSFAATAFAAEATGCTVEFIDADINSWNMNLDILEEKCHNNKKIKYVIDVHTYGNPYDYNRLVEIASRYGLIIIEDACEGLMGKYNGKNVGQLGDVSVFSFYSNKLCASGESGIVLTDDDRMAERMRLYKGQGQDPNRRFWHITRGFNYRMTNLQAAVILSQFKRIQAIQNNKINVYHWYKTMLLPEFKFQDVIDGAEHSWWMVSVLHKGNKFYEVASRVLEEKGIETRPIFPPLPTMPAFNPSLLNGPVITNAKYLNEHGISLPSGPGLTFDEVKYICDNMNLVAKALK